MAYKVGQVVKVHYWTRWVDGKVVEIIPHYKEGMVIKVDFQGVFDTYQDFILDEIQNNYKEETK